MDPRAIKRISGPSWEELRPKFYLICDALLSVSNDAFAELTTIYVKISLKNPKGNLTYAVVWIKHSSEITVGLSLPDGIKSKRLFAPPKRMKYTNLTSYFMVKKGEKVPAEIYKWANLAYENIQRQDRLSS